jgi:hypothetical protein
MYERSTQNVSDIDNNSTNVTVAASGEHEYLYNLDSINFVDATCGQYFVPGNG